MKKILLNLIVFSLFILSNVSANAGDMIIPSNEPFYIKFDQAITYADRGQPFEMSVADSVRYKRGYGFYIKLEDKTYSSPDVLKKLNTSGIKFVGTVGRTKEARIFNRSGYYDINITGIKLKNGDIYPAKLKLIKVMDRKYARIKNGQNKIRIKKAFWHYAGKSDKEPWDIFDCVITPAFGAIAGVPYLLGKGYDKDLYKDLPVKVQLEREINISKNANKMNPTQKINNVKKEIKETQEEVIEQKDENETLDI